MRNAAESNGRPSLVREPAVMPYLPQLDGIRAIAVLIVFVGHAGYGHLVPGGFGVTVFFFLSGYLITTLLRIELRTTGRISLRDFYLRRALRIMPPMYLALAFSGALYALGLLTWLKVEAVGVLGQLTYTSNYEDLLGTNKVLPVPLWSLAIEEHFYLVFPLAFIVWLGRLAPRRAALACLSVCLLVLAIRGLNVWRLPDFSLNYQWTHTRIDSILFGCCLGLWNNPVIPDDKAWTPRAWHIGISVLVIVGTLAFRDPIFRETIRYTLQGAALFVVFLAIIQNSGVVAKWLSIAPMRLLGLYSYSFYLFHYTIITLLLHLQPSISAPMMVLYALPLTLVCCWAVYTFVERPCARLRRRLTDASDRPPEPSLAGGGHSAMPHSALTRA